MYKPSSHFFNTRHVRSRGFTLLELLVVTAIMIIITSMLLARHSQFNGTVLLRNLAYDIALSIRQAQVYGITGRTASTTAAVTDAIGVKYGVYFTSGTPVGTATTYTFFADKNNNGAYNNIPGSINDETLEVYSLRAGYVILNICATVGGGGTHCATGGTEQTITSLTIMFKRPNPDALISTSYSSAPNYYTNASITVRSATGMNRVVSVSTTGQIAVQ